jgi:hypothetical protein
VTVNESRMSSKYKYIAMSESRMSATEIDKYKYMTVVTQVVLT